MLVLLILDPSQLFFDVLGFLELRLAEVLVSFLEQAEHLAIVEGEDDVGDPCVLLAEVVLLLQVFLDSFSEILFKSTDWNMISPGIRV